MAPPESGPNSGGDLFDMAKDGTTVPEDSAQPRLIPSKARPDQYATTKASEADPNFLGGTNLAEAADNASDIPRVSSHTLCPSRSHRGHVSMSRLATFNACHAVSCANRSLTRLVRVRETMNQ